MAANPLVALGLSAAAIDGLRLLYLLSTGDLERFWFQGLWTFAFGVAGAASLWQPPAALAGGGGTGAYILWAFFDTGQQCVYSVCL